MKVPFTHKILRDWAGSRVYREGKALFESRAVRRAAFEVPVVQGELAYGNRIITCQFKVLPDGSAVNQCPCRDSTERGIVCSHVIALAMELIRRSHDPERARQAQEEMRRARRLAEINEADYIQRQVVEDPAAVDVRLHLSLPCNWPELAASGRIPLSAGMSWNGNSLPLDQVPKDHIFRLSPQDDALLFVLEDIVEGPAQGKLTVDTKDFCNLLDLHQGKALDWEGRPDALTVNAARMTPHLQMDLDRENGELILMVHTELPFMDPGSFPMYLVAGRSGWIYDAGHWWPFDNPLPGPLQVIYAQPIVVERTSVLRFLQTELPLIEAHIPVHSDITSDLFSVEPADPEFRLILRGSPASLAATLIAVYDNLELVAGKPDAEGQFARPDPDDLLRFTVRHPKAENRALDRLSAEGMRGSRGDEMEPIVGTREVLNFLGSSVPKLRRYGWKIELEGRVEPFMEELDFATPVVRVDNGNGQDWFEVGFSFEDSRGGSLQEADIQRALLRGDAYIQRNGRTILLDADAINTAREVFSDCASLDGYEAGTFRLSGIHSAFIQSSLDALDGIDVEAAPEWQARARVQNRQRELEHVTLPATLDATLRPYQHEGIDWLRFLEGNYLAGILADEMGLGKTIQMLAWILMSRIHEEAQNQPVLIVCPTSLVENWAEEAARFTPGLKVLMIQGSDRHRKREQIGGVDIAITSYALMRRDVEHYLEREFSAVVLDEAQHIKNRSTQNALAAKQLRAVHRFVLTGTPIENSVSDLWSIMDFLMPGYLGNHRVFRDRYELPISRGGPEGEAAQGKLRRKLHPFLLRRLKKEVARDLPPKIERVATCRLTVDQQQVYRQLVDTSRRRITDMVQQKGFNQSRMEILKTLMRLRQTCCHLDLLKLDGLHAEQPSAKMDLFFELLDEAVDSGHRVLVFSQFTSMLAILRRELESRGLTYCYLDGATKDRLKIVREFNTNRSIPAFLISLRAGGTGLNLTGADMVIHFDPWWNPAVEDQATDRAYRIGQHRTVYSIKMITKGTVEDKVVEMQKRKKSIIDATLSRDEEVMDRLTWEDVQELLEL